MKTCSRSKASAFTLIEMIITLSVFLLLAGAIFSIFGATLQSAATLQENQNREDSSQALAAWLRHIFIGLPADGVLFSYHRESESSGVSGIVWGSGNDLHALDVVAQPNGLWELRLAAYQSDNSQSEASMQAAVVAAFQTQILNHEQELTWRPLLRDLKRVSWQFRGVNSTTWVDATSGSKPNLVQLVFQPAGMLNEVVDDFWLPPLVPAGNPALPIATPSVSANL